ncbi:MAG: hypothetical protein NZZ41_06405 [Candidatus Dojkabacteria bacterium]|nr:hypothetical protein [Candidatus Dojkabacteria bacterium]
MQSLSIVIQDKNIQSKDMSETEIQQSVINYLKFTNNILHLNLDIDKITNTSILTISPAKENKYILLEQVQTIIKFLLLKDTNIKIVIILNAELLTEEAQNAMLKVLEEHTFNSLIILVTRSFNDLLKTILSRCIKLETNTEKEEATTSNISKLIEENKIIDWLVDKDDENSESSSNIKNTYQEVIRYYINTYLDYINSNNKLNFNRTNILEKISKLCSVLNFMQRSSTLNYQLLKLYLFLIIET